jgi:hypothetical protein
MLISEASVPHGFQRSHAAVCKRNAHEPQLGVDHRCGRASCRESPTHPELGFLRFPEVGERCSCVHQWPEVLNLSAPPRITTAEETVRGNILAADDDQVDRTVMRGTKMVWYTRSKAAVRTMKYAAV